MKNNSSEVEYLAGQEITIPKGTELNFAPHEDSDYITLTTDVRAKILASRNNGAILVQLLDRHNKNIGHPLYFHQPAN